MPQHALMLLKEGVFAADTFPFANGFSSLVNTVLRVTLTYLSLAGNKGMKSI